MARVMARVALAGSLVVLAACSFEPSTAPADDTPGEDASVIDGPPGPPVPDAPRIDATPISITCPGSMCGPICCDGTCSNPTTGACTGRSFACDGPEDCPPSQVCCNDQNGSRCAAACAGGFEVCHTAADCSFSCNDCGFRSDYGQNVCCE